jgi:hypothetical protein
MARKDYRADRVSIRVDKNIRNKVQQWAAKEDLPPAEMYRRLLEWATDHYSRVGDLARLRSMLVVGQTAKGERESK